MNLQESNRHNTFEWNDQNLGTMSSIDNIVGGIYWLTITDNAGCSATSEFELEDGKNQTFDIIMTDPSCDESSDGSIEISELNTNDGPYIIIINDQEVDNQIVSGLSAGEYNIRVIDANLCELNGTASLIALNDLSFADYQEIYNIIEGDSISIVGTIDTGSYTYIWEPNCGALICTD